MIGMKDNFAVHVIARVRSPRRGQVGVRFGWVQVRWSHVFLFAPRSRGRAGGAFRAGHSRGNVGETVCSVLRCVMTPMCALTMTIVHSCTVHRVLSGSVFGITPTPVDLVCRRHECEENLLSAVHMDSEKRPARPAAPHSLHFPLEHALALRATVDGALAP